MQTNKYLRETLEISFFALLKLLKNTLLTTILCIFILFKILLEKTMIAHVNKIINILKNFILEHEN